MNTKRILAVLLSTVMVVGSSVTAFASDATDTVSATTIAGAGTAEGLVDKEVFLVTLPTITTNKSLKYVIDPQGLIEETEAAAYDYEDVTYGTLYFTHYQGTDGAASGIGPSTDTFKVINKSSFDVNVNVKVKATAATTGDVKPALSNAKTYETTDTATKVYLGYKDNGAAATEIALTNSDQTSANYLESAEDAYGVTYAENAYAYELTDENFGFATLEFSMNGSVNPYADYGTDASKVGLPEISLVYDIAKASGTYTVNVEASESGSSATSEYQLTLNTTNNNLTYTFASNAPTGTLTAMKLNGASKGGNQISQGNITYSGGKVVIKAAAVTAMGIKTGDKIVFTIGDADYNFKY